MSTDANFNKYLPLIMATVPADSKTCGLESFGNEMPQITVKDDSGLAKFDA